MKTYFHTNVRLPRRKANFLVLIFLQLVACSLWGQALQKKTLTVADYENWGKLKLNAINENGQWVSYTMLYENKPKTLFVKNTKTAEEHAFISGTRGNFITADRFVCHIPQGVQLMDLRTGHKDTIPQATQYVYAKGAKKLILTMGSNSEKTLLIRNINGTGELQIKAVEKFEIDPSGRMLLYSTNSDSQSVICLLNLSGKEPETIVTNNAGTFSNLTWHPNGKLVVFTQETGDKESAGSTVFYYRISDKKLQRYTPQMQQKSFGDSLYVQASASRLKISDDMQRVFLAMHSKEEPVKKKDSDVQIWNGNAKWVYPMAQKRKLFEKSYIAMWSVADHRDVLISCDSLPQLMLNGNQKYAIISNEKQYEPQFAFEGLRDFYIVDLSTGERKLFLKAQYGNPQYTIPSPNGKYMAYFREKNWWVYDFEKESHTNITKNIGEAFFHNEGQHPQTIDSYPTIGWTQEDREFILCDAYDYWSIKPDGAAGRRLTHGRESKMKFRFPDAGTSFITKPNYDGSIHETIDLKRGLLLEAGNQLGHTGYYKLTQHQNKKLVFSTTTQLDQMIFSTDGTTFTYTEQDYNLSPRVVIETCGNKKPKVLFQSNPQQEDFHWGRSELMQYKNSKGDTLQGVLYYPAQYDKHKKYPMIVFIYEKLSGHLHDYINPSQFTGDAQFNITSFITQGYFVLAPDISYEVGNVGKSATDCVVSAVNEIISRGLVLPDKIGLTGHSFGGYETDFIITQTDLFAAAVAGSAATDMASFYLTMGWNTGKPDMWRFESQQWRMGKSLFEDWEGYNRNSPIANAVHISTPLLSWTGDNDLQVNWSQSIAFYLALRRLKKQHIMLLYPGEKHTLNRLENQKDLSIRLHQWFDYHLKDIKADWIVTGLK